MEVTIIGPNLTTKQERLGRFHVHAKGCADIRRQYDVREAWDTKVESKREAVYAVYADIIAEHVEDDGGEEGAYRMCADDLHFAPCCSGLK